MGLELATGGVAAYPPNEGSPGGLAYPEVSGYLIPTLFDYAGGETQNIASVLAIRIANWLVDLQDEDGWWPDMKGKARAFDTGACMEGLGRAFQETGDPRYQEAATRAWDWLESLELEDGSLRTTPESKKTHLYMLRVSGLMGNDKPVKMWKEKAWDVTRVHYAAYALEGLWMLGEMGFVTAQLLLARRAFVPLDGQHWSLPERGPETVGPALMPFTAGSSWRNCSGTDTCATAQMAILYHQAGFYEDAQRLAAGVRCMTDEDGGVRLGREHAERNSWTAKWVLDMCHVLQCQVSSE